MDWRDIRDGAIYAVMAAALLLFAWMCCLSLRDWWVRRKRPKKFTGPVLPESDSELSSFDA